MSIILKGIDLPKQRTQIIIYPNGFMFCADKDGVYVPNTQAIQIDRPHGRLIDADTLKRELSVIADRPIRSGMYIIKEAPTILEAEDE